MHLEIVLLIKSECEHDGTALKEQLHIEFQFLKENHYLKCLKCLFGGLIVKDNDFVENFCKLRSFLDAFHMFSNRNYLHFN